MFNVLHCHSSKIRKDCTLADVDVIVQSIYKCIEFLYMYVYLIIRFPIIIDHMLVLYVL